MRTYSEDISRGWQTISSNSGSSHNTSSERPSPPVYTPAAANYFATHNYNAATSSVLTAAASRRHECSGSKYALPSPLLSYIEMQDLGAGAGAGAASSISAPASRTPSVLPGPATQPQKQSGARKLALTMLNIVVFVIVLAAFVGIFYGLYQLTYLIFPGSK